VDFPEPKEWALAEFGAVRLGHRARTKRAVQLAAALAENPGASLPVACGTWGGTKAAYRFLQGTQMDHETLLAPHWEATVERCRGRQAILAIQDTTFIRLRGRKREASEEFGPIDGSGATGFIVHSCLAADAASGEILGLLDQRPWIRSRETYSGKETRAQRRARSRESDHWAASQKRVATRLARLREDKPHVIAVFDRDGDEFRALSTVCELGHGCVIRAARNRAVSSDGERETRDVLDSLVGAPPMGHCEIQVPAQPGRSARRADLTLRACTVEINPPQHLQGYPMPVQLQLVSAVEEHPPPNVESLSWILLTHLPVTSRAEVLEVVHHYERRWLIEEFHMGLKTGCSIELRQLQTLQAMENFLAFASAIATRLLQLRDCARRPKVRASDVLGATLLPVLLALRRELPKDCSAYEALRAIAKMGGFLGRRGDGEPGWRSIWRGYRELLISARAWHLAKESG
jgi:hypothetical protein